MANGMETQEIMGIERESNKSLQKEEMRSRKRRERKIQSEKVREEKI